MAALMQADLRSRRLIVDLVFPHWAERGMRLVSQRNPRWYRQFCDTYSPSNRTRLRQREKRDTYIKRAHTLRALGEIANGRCNTLYAERLLPWVEDELKLLPQNEWMIE